MEKLRYKCLAMDHDDTVVNSTATIHYPSFVDYTKIYFPDFHMSLDEYFLKNFDPGVVALFRDIVGMTEEQIANEEEFWNGYVKKTVPKSYEGIREILEKQRDRGGIICVISHSYTENILRDYRENRLPEPDMVFGWESPAEERKPNPYPLLQIQKKYGLKPEEILVVDDLKPGFDMARAAGVPFAAAGWANDIPQIEKFMRNNCDRYFKTVRELDEFLFGGSI